jgi:signal peptidase II
MRPLLFLLFAVFIIAFDQFSKWYVLEQVLRPQMEPPAQENAQTDSIPAQFINWYKTPPRTIGPAEMTVIPNFNIVSVWNKGVSFGMFNKASDKGPMILIGISLAISLLFLIWLFRRPDNMQSAGIVMVIGGALGNVIDRLRFGAVFDFLDFHAFDYHWPAFNIADSGIVLGVAVLVIHSFLYERKNFEDKHREFPR